jgi:hypothetical protein
MTNVEQIRDPAEIELDDFDVRVGLALAQTITPQANAPCSVHAAPPEAA